MSGKTDSSRVEVAAQIELGGRVLDFARGEVRFPNGQSSPLSDREAQLLRFLAQNSGRVVSRDEILAQVWQLPSQRILTRVIDMHVAHLRDKLRDPKAALLRTVYGQGYMFVAP